MQIALQQQAMHVIGGSASWRQTKEWVAEVLHALPELAAEVEVASRSNVEGDEFDRRPEIVWPRAVLLISRNVIVAQKVIGSRRIAQYLAEELRGEQKEQERDERCDDGRAAADRELLDLARFIVHLSHLRTPFLVDE